MDVQEYVIIDITSKHNHATLPLTYDYSDFHLETSFLFKETCKCECYRVTHNRERLIIFSNIKENLDH